MHAPALWRAKRPGLADQSREGTLADGGDDHLAHDTLRAVRRRRDHAQQDAGLAAHLARLLDQLVDDAALGLDRDAVRDPDQQLDQAVHHLGRARDAPEGQQGQADALGMAAQLPGAFHRRTPTEPLGLLRMQAAQQVDGQGESSEPFELGDLRQQALQPDPAGVGCKPGVGRAVAIVGQKRTEPFAHPGIQPAGHALQRRVVMDRLGRAQDAAKAVGTGPGHAVAGKPEVEFLIQRGRAGLAQEHVMGQPVPEPGLGCLVERADCKVVDDGHPVPAPAPACPCVAVQRVGAHPDLAGKMRDHGRGHVRLRIGKAAVLAPERKLHRKAEPAGINPPGQQSQILGQQRPALAQLLRQPLTLHRVRLRQPSRQQAYKPKTKHVTPDGQNAQLRGHWTYNDRRQRVLGGQTPNHVVAQRLEAQLGPARSASSGRTGPCDLTKARLIADSAKEVSQPDIGGAAGHSGQSADFVLPAFAHQVALIAAGRQGPVLRVGSLDAHRDFLDVRNVCTAYVTCAARAEALEPDTVLNIASGALR